MAHINTIPHFKNAAVDPQAIKIKARDNRPSDMSMALIKRVHDAVKAGYIHEPFTAKNVEIWMIENHIRKEDGTKYKDGYVATLLSTSYIGKRMKKNRNSICLDRRKNKDGIFEYWFID